VITNSKFNSKLRKPLPSHAAITWLSWHFLVLLQLQIATVSSQIDHMYQYMERFR
jgi:hypothetical protein